MFTVGRVIVIELLLGAALAVYYTLHKSLYLSRNHSTTEQSSTTRLGCHSSTAQPRYNQSVLNLLFRSGVLAFHSNRKPSLKILLCINKSC